MLVAMRPGMTSRKQAEILGGHYFDVAHTYPLSRQMFLRADVRRMLGPEVPLTNAVFNWLVAELAPGKKAFGLPFLSQVSLAEMRTYMGHTLLRDADQFSMSHALEVRVHFSITVGGGRAGVSGYGQISHDAQAVARGRLGRLASRRGGEPAQNGVCPSMGGMASRRVEGHLHRRPSKFERPRMGAF